MIGCSIEALSDGNERDKELAKILEGVLDARCGEDIPFPEQFPVKTVETQAPKVDLRQQAYHFLTLVRKPSTKEREVLETARGLIFLLLESKSYAQVVAEDPDYFWQDELQDANIRIQLRDYVLPKALEAGFNRTQLALPGSFNCSRPFQLQMIEDYSQKLQALFPDARAIMLPSTGYAQADRAYKARTGSVLFSNYFARALDDTFWGNAACAGRYVPAARFHVYDWLAADGNDGGRVAVPTVVFIRNK